MAEEEAKGILLPDGTYQAHGISILRGYLDLSSAALRENFYPGLQGIGAAVAAASYANLKDAYEWDQGDLDDIVKAANWIYNVSVHNLMTLHNSVFLNPLTQRMEPPIGLGDLEYNFVIGRTEYFVEMVFVNRGFVDQEPDDENHTIMVMALAEFFNCCTELSPYGVIENHGDYYALWKHYSSSSVFVFDPFPSRASPQPALYRIKSGSGLLDFFRTAKGWKASDMYSLYNLLMKNYRLCPESHQHGGSVGPRRSARLQEQRERATAAAAAAAAASQGMDMDTDSPACSPPSRPPHPSPRLMRYFQLSANPDQAQQWQVNQMDCDDDDD